jgi:hypothetical protein
LTDWSSTEPETAYTTLAASTKVIDSVFTTEEPVTITRVVGQLDVISDQLSAFEKPFGAMGTALVTDQARVAGAASIPGPYTAAESDVWFLHQFWVAPVLFATAVGISKTNQTYQMDSRAMRRMTPEDSMVIMIENGSLFGVDYRLDLRILIKVA